MTIFVVNLAVLNLLNILIVLFLFIMCNHDFLCGVQYVARKKKLE